MDPLGLETGHPDGNLRGFMYTGPAACGPLASRSLKTTPAGSKMIGEAQTKGGTAADPALAVSPSRASSSSSLPATGFSVKAEDMAPGLSLNPTVEGTAAESVVEFTDGGYSWRVDDAHAPTLRAGGVDWFNLAGCDDATLVKRNCHREVWRVRCGGAAYFAKLYHPRGLGDMAKLLIRGPTALREWQVGRYAAAHSIAAAVPVAVALKGFRGIGGPSLFITEAVLDVEPLNDYWQRIRDDRHQANLLIESLATLIARAHQCGFQHGDMHPGNILVRQVGQRGEALFVDLHDVKTGAPVSLNGIVANLALLHQWFRRHSALTRRWRFLQTYLRCRDCYAQASPHARNIRVDARELVSRLAIQVERHANRLWSKRDRRTRRTGRYFARIAPAAGWRGHALLQSKHPSPTAQAALLTFEPKQWESWLADPISWLDAGRHELVKDSHTATICKAALPTSPEPATVIVKRPLARNMGKRIAHILGPSRNMRAWKMANMLLNRDLPVAQPLAVVERYWAGLIRIDSVSFTDFIDGSNDLETFLTRDLAALPAARQRQVKDRLIASTARLLGVFHTRGFAHRDMKAPNLLLSWDPPYDGPPQFTFIDMDGISYVGQTSKAQRRRAIVRLCASLLGSPGCTRTDRLRFLKQHLTGFGRAPSRWKTVWRELDERVSAKRNTKEARRVWKLKHYGRE